MNFAAVDVRDVAPGDVIETLSLEAACERGIADRGFAPMALFDYPADRDEIGIVLKDLVSNAVKYNRDGGRVDVTIRSSSDAVTRFEVADTGIGMNAGGGGHAVQ